MLYYNSKMKFWMLGLRADGQKPVRSHKIFAATYTLTPAKKNAYKHHPENACAAAEATENLRSCSNII